jgi:hypothetical protein
MDSSGARKPLDQQVREEVLRSGRKGASLSVRDKIDEDYASRCDSCLVFPPLPSDTNSVHGRLQRRSRRLGSEM